MNKRSYADVVSGSGSSESESELLCSVFAPPDTTSSPIFKRHKKTTTGKSSGRLWRKALNKEISKAKAKKTSIAGCDTQGNRERDGQRHGTVDCPITISSPETSPPKKKEEVPWTRVNVDSATRRHLFDADDDEPLEVKFQGNHGQLMETNDSEDTYSRYAGEFYDGDRRTPVFTCDSAPTVGKKSQRPSTSRRKGGRGQAVNIVPRPSASEQAPSPSAAPTPSPVLPPTAVPPAYKAPPPSPSAAPPPFAAPPFAAPQPVVSQPSELPLTFPLSPSNALGRVPYPSPLPGQFIVYPLKFCPPQVSICYGCSNTLKPGGQIPLPPHDLVVASNMMRSFQHGGQMRSKQSNVYFHCSGACIRAKQPYFSHCSMPWFIRSSLTDQQLDFLSKMFPVYALP